MLWDQVEPVRRFISLHISEGETGSGLLIPEERGIVVLATSRMRFVNAGMDSWMFAGSGREEVLEARL